MAIIIAVGGIYFRLYWLFYEHPPRNYLYSDMQIYYDTALRMLEPGYTGRIDETTHPPATSYLMALTYRYDPNWVLFTIIQFIMCAAVPFLVGAVGYELFGTRVALIAVAITSLYFPFADYAGYFLAENPFLFFLMLSTWLLAVGLKAERPALNLTFSLLSGLMLGLALTFKGQAWMPAVLIGCFLALVGWKYRLKRMWLIHAGIAVGMMLIVVPVSIRATRINEGRLAIIATNGPMNVLFGHCGEPGMMIFDDQKRGFHFEMKSPSANEHNLNNVYIFPFGPYDGSENMAAAWNWIREHKIEALWRSLDNVFDQFFIWEAWPTNGTKFRRWTIVFQQIFIVFILFPACAFALEKLRPILRLQSDVLGDILMLLPVIGISIGAFMTVGEVRYRVPFDGFLILLAARCYVRVFTTLPAQNATAPS